MASIETLIPHRPPFLFVDEVVSHTGEMLTARRVYDGETVSDVLAFASSLAVATVSASTALEIDAEIRVARASWAVFADSSTAM